MKLIRFTRLARVRGVDIDLHWSVMLIATIFLVAAFQNPLMTLVGGASYIALMVLHECGHMVAAQRKGSHVFGIQVYPIFAVCRHEAAWSRVDNAVIAWGGVAAQAWLAIPITAYVVRFGYTPWEPANVVLAIFGPLSLLWAVFNLLPFPPLDGSKAWDLFPALLVAKRNRKMTRAARRGF